MTQDTGLLTLRCPATGLDYNVGVRMDPASFSSLPEMSMTAQCTHCGQQHRWQPSEAKLKRDDVTIAHRRVG
jgi:hypothetical protein